MAEPITSNYPGALDSDTTLGGDAVNLTSFVLNGAINSAVDVLPLTTTITGLVNTPCYVLINSEVIYAATKTATSFTGCVRGVGGTTAASHSDGSSVKVVYAAGAFNQLKRAIIAIETELGTDVAGSETDLKTRLANPGIDIHAAASKATPVDADELGLYDSAAPTVFKKLTWANLKATFMTSLGALIAALTGKTTPVDADTLVMSDSAAAGATKSLTWANVKATLKTYLDTLYVAIAERVISGPSGFGDNYALSPSVSSNNLTLAIKGIDGSDPSASNPIRIRVGNTVYTITAATSFTKNAGTNWCNSGSPETATKDVDYFVYAIAETGASAGIKFGFSRIPFAKTMNDFTNTATSDRYIAGNWTNFNATDSVAVIGRFKATLSATASFNWSMPNAVIVNRPIFETDWLVWVPTITGGYSSPPTSTLYQYQIVGRNVFPCMTESGNGTSNSTADASYSLPLTVGTITNGLWITYAYVINNSIEDDGGYAYLSSGGTTITFRRNKAAAWTASGGRRIILPNGLSYPLA